MTAVLASWSRRRWLVALGTGAATVLVIALPTALIPTPVFGREVPPTAWAWPVLLVTSVLSGLLVATYVREPGADLDVDRAGRTGVLGGLLTFFAVGCPVCNKLALLALGSTPVRCSGSGRSSRTSAPSAWSCSPGRCGSGSAVRWPAQSRPPERRRRPDRPPSGWPAV